MGGGTRKFRGGLARVIAQYAFSDYLARAQAAQPDATTLAGIEASYSYRLDITVQKSIKDGQIELPMHFSQGEGGFHQLEPAVIFYLRLKHSN